MGGGGGAKGGREKGQILDKNNKHQSNEHSDSLSTRISVKRSLEDLGTPPSQHVRVVALASALVWVRHARLVRVIELPQSSKVPRRLDVCVDVSTARRPLAHLAPEKSERVSTAGGSTSAAFASSTLVSLWQSEAKLVDRSSTAPAVCLASCSSGTRIVVWAVKAPIVWNAFPGALRKVATLSRARGVPLLSFVFVKG